MSTTTAPSRGRQYMAPPETHSQKLDEVYRQTSYDCSFDSIRYPSNASQPSLSHSINTHTESTPSSVCRPDFGDYPHDMSQSDCGASFVSEVPPSFDDNSDIDEVPVPSNNSKPTLIKFVEPVVQRDHISGQQRLTGMKKKNMQKKLAAAVGGGSEMDVHQLPVLGFGDVRGGRYSGDDEELHRDTLKFPGVPPREVHTPLRHEQWNVDTIDIALEDLVLDKGKTRSMTQSQSSVGQGVGAKARGAAAHSIMDEAQVDEKQYLPAQPRVHTLSDARRRAPPFDMPLPPLPPLPSSATVSSHRSTTPASNGSGKAGGLQPSLEHPLASTARTSAASSTRTSARNSAVLPQHQQQQHGTPRYSPEEEENIFAFAPPSISGHGEEADLRATGTLGARLDSITTAATSSSHHSHSGSSSLTRDLDPREVIQRARLQPMSCGLDAEVAESSSLDLASESYASGLVGSASTSSTHGSNGGGVHAEDLPPLLSNHYFQSKEFSAIDQSEYERLNLIPERMQAAAAAAAAASGSHKLSHKHLSKHKKNTANTVTNNYEPISILRAEAAFLKEDVKEKKKKTSLWGSHNSHSSSSVASSRQSHGSSSLGGNAGRLGGGGANTSMSDVSSAHSGEGHQRLRSFKSSIRLKSMK